MSNTYTDADILFFTVHELEPHWDGVLLWLE